MTFSNRILLGLATGVLLGLFLGERVRVLEWAANGFVKLLQMTVLPYVTISIVGRLGTLDAAQAKALGLRAGAVVVGLWAVALVFAMSMPLMFPRVENASFFSTTLLERPAPFNFIDLYIPSNPFYSLANNIVPAVVLFSVILGIALIGMPRKQPLLDVLAVASEALSRATRFIVSLTPYGLFAIAAVAAGTLDVEQLGRLQVYLISYVIMALLLGLWVLPGLVAALTPIRMGQIFRLTRDALITAFVAGDLFIVLPVLIEASKTLLSDPAFAGAGTSGASGATAAENAASLPGVIVPASFNFPHAGKLLSLSFILFAGWFADASVAFADYPRLALTGLVTFFGSLNVAVPFLLDLFRIPADTFQLFLATGVINSRFGTLVAASHTVAVALLGTCAMTGLVTWNSRRLLTFAGITVLLTVTAIVGTRLLFASVLDQHYTKDKVLAGMHLLRESPRAVVHRALPVPAALQTPAGTTQLEAVRSRGKLRIGYVSDALPFAFFNASGELVGLDIELAHRLSLELGVSAEFVPIDRANLPDLLSSGYCDIVMSGVAVTTDRAGEVLFSSSYMDETVALLVPDHARHRFATWDGIRALGPITVAVPDVPYYGAKLREMLPRAHLAIVNDIAKTLAAPEGSFDAFALPAERGSAWTLIHPRFTVVVPEPQAIKVPLAFPIARHDLAFATFVNTWIDLKRKDGTIDELYRHWILGQQATVRRPRWSILRDVLHWTDS